MKTLILSILVATSLSTAQDFRDNQELLNHLEKQSGLLTVKLIPGAKNIKVFVVGYEKANIKFTDLGVEASVIIAGAERRLKVLREADHFKIERSVKTPMKLDLKIKAPENTNTLQFDVP